MTDYQLKTAAIQKLFDTTGKKLLTATRMQDICIAIGRPPRAGLSPRRILQDYLCIPQPEPKVYVNPVYRREFREMVPERIKPHPRAADIDAGQPAMMTMQGIGNFKQPGGFIPVVDRW